MKCIEILIKYFWFYSKLHIMNGYPKLPGVLYDRLVEADDMDPSLATQVYLPLSAAENPKRTKLRPLYM